MAGGSDIKSPTNRLENTVVSQPDTSFPTSKRYLYPDKRPSAKKTGAVLSGDNNEYDVSEYDIQALVDEQITETERKLIMKKIMRNPEAMLRMETLIRQKKSLKEWWRSEWEK